MFAAWKTLCPLSEDTEVTDYFSVFSVLRGLFLFSTDDTEVTDEVFSVFSVLCGLFLFSTDDTEVTDCFSVFSVLRGLFYQFQQFERTFHFCKTKEVYTEGEHSGAAVVFVEVALQTFQATCLDAYFAA